MNRLHVTATLVPIGFVAVGAVLGPSFFKLTVLKIEIGVCWLDHSVKAGGFGVHL